MKHFLLLFVIVLLELHTVFSQSCTPQGDQTTYGMNNIWIGYVYDNANLTNYRGYVNQGNSSNPNFDQNFGGDNVSYATNGCLVVTETFSVRYRLTKYFASGNYRFVVGGDDGYRLSLDGGSTWVINNWGDHSYATTTYNTALNGTYNIVLEFYENGGANRISFDLTTLCTATENTSVYGTNNIWNAYVYDGTNFNIYHGMVNVGSSSNPNFDVNFGGSNTTYNTTGCSLQTETFSVRYRLNKSFSNGTYQFTVGGDDGYRFSIDGGATWLIDRWVLQSYASTTSSAVIMNGDYDLVVEYYENTGDNRVTFSMQQLMILPVTMKWLTVSVRNNETHIDWAVSSDSNSKVFEIERSNTGNDFELIGKVQPGTGLTQFSFTDNTVDEGRYYYRLKITDLNGVVTYSKVEKVFIAGKNSGLTIYPTIVAGNSFNIKAGGTLKNVQVTVADLSGRVIHEQKMGNVNAGQIMSISSNRISVSKGMLFVTIRSTDGYNATQTLLVQ